MSKFRKRLVDNAGFTLIELLVVIAVLGILAGIAIPRLAGVTDKAKDSAISTFAGAVKTGMDMYYVEHDDEYPSAIADMDALRTSLDTVSTDDELSNYNIASFTYASDSNTEGDVVYYLFTFTSSSNSDKKYYLGEKGFSDTQTEASDGTYS